MKKVLPKSAYRIGSEYENGSKVEVSWNWKKDIGEGGNQKEPDISAAGLPNKLVRTRRSMEFIHYIMLRCEISWKMSVSVSEAVTQSEPYHLD
ncbi:hypothetical protein NPIL_337261 [Nephila pilipes]|uniref:Uncharacterized protein n=1 Tax=Nephila pilipes TaxID=299642 RepID=A0A8X6U4U7_NEPPI|nr:hypothetical protein NPIL_337261 [Nephila pilipes]